MPNMEKRLNQISTKVTRAPNEPLWISKTHLEYAYGHLKHPKKQANIATFRQPEER